MTILFLISIGVVLYGITWITGITYNKNKKGNDMGKEEVVAEQVQAVQAGEVQALVDGLGKCYDQGLADAPAPTGTFTQADIDAAVNAAKAVDAEEFANAKALSDSAIQELQGKLDVAITNLTADEAALQGMKDSADKLQAAVDLIHALFPSM